MKVTKLKKGQTGNSLLEALVAILIFSLGLVGLLRLQSVSVKNSIDAKYRSDASYLTNQIIAQMWLDRTNIDNYAYNETGTVCGLNVGGSSGNANVTSWVTQLASTLPGTASTKAQIQISTPVTSTKLVKVSVCWQGPQDASAHNFSTTAQINQ
jgi:type IV pilus assembly protein PilV